MGLAERINAGSATAGVTSVGAPASSLARAGGTFSRATREKVRRDSFSYRYGR